MHSTPYTILFNKPIKKEKVVLFIRSMANLGLVPSLLHILSENINGRLINAYNMSIVGSKTYKSELTISHNWKTYNSK